jgi:hypothetical protein
VTALLDFATQRPWWTLVYLMVIFGSFASALGKK